MKSSEIQAVRGIAPLLASGVFKLAVPPLTAPSAAAILQVPGTGRVIGHVFKVVFGGEVTMAADGNATFALQVGTDTVAANNTTIATTGAVATTAAAGATPFYLEVDLFYGKGGVLVGSYSGQVGQTMVARTVNAAFPSGLNDANEPVFNLVVNGTLATAGSSANLTVFAIEA